MLFFSLSITVRHLYAWFPVNVYWAKDARFSGSDAVLDASSRLS